MVFVKIAARFLIALTRPAVFVPVLVATTLFVGISLGRITAPVAFIERVTKDLPKADPGGVFSAVTGGLVGQQAPKSDTAAEEATTDSPDPTPPSTPMPTPTPTPTPVDQTPTSVSPTPTPTPTSIPGEWIASPAPTPNPEPTPPPPIHTTSVNLSSHDGSTPEGSGTITVQTQKYADGSWITTTSGEITGMTPSYPFRLMLCTSLGFGESECYVMNEATTDNEGKASFGSATRHVIGISKVAVYGLSGGANVCPRSSRTSLPCLSGDIAFPSE